jgi:hypothetical protein
MSFRVGALFFNVERDICLGVKVVRAVDCG